MQTIAFICPPLDPEHPYPKNSAIMTRHANKLRTSIWYLNVWGPSPVPDGTSLSILANTSGEGPTHQKLMSKG